MRKRIKSFLSEKNEKKEFNPKDAKDRGVYMELLINDLKTEVKVMPRYSLWNELVNKCLFEKNNKN